MEGEVTRACPSAALVAGGLGKVCPHFGAVSLRKGWNLFSGSVRK